MAWFTVSPVWLKALTPSPRALEGRRESRTKGMVAGEGESVPRWRHGWDMSQVLMWLDPQSPGRGLGSMFPSFSKLASLYLTVTFWGGRKAVKRACEVIF